MRRQLSAHGKPGLVSATDMTSEAGKTLAARFGIDVAPAVVSLHDGHVVARVVRRPPNGHEWHVLLEVPSDA